MVWASGIEGFANSGSDGNRGAEANIHQARIQASKRRVVRLQDQAAVGVYLLMHACSLACDCLRCAGVFARALGGWSEQALYMTVLGCMAACLLLCLRCLCCYMAYATASGTAGWAHFIAGMRRCCMHAAAHKLAIHWSWEPTLQPRPRCVQRFTKGISGHGASHAHALHGRQVTQLACLQPHHGSCRARPPTPSSTRPNPSPPSGAS